MISTIVVLVVLAGGLITSIIFPVHLPQPMLDAVEEFLLNLTPFDGVFPVYTLLKALGFIIFFRLMHLIFKIVMGIIGLVTGSGTPESE